ncbi:MAG: hypothetical protein K6G23_07400, partial [Lachnospiraceae bacterium]|nr:hypothetical protein [Lachnospiraceae bacterium]
MNKHPWNDNSIRCVLAIVIVELVMIAHYAITLCQPHETMHFTAENLQMQGGAFLEDGSFFIGEESGITDATVLSTGKMTLQPGVYEVYLAFTSQAEQLTEVCSASAGYGALLSNAVTMRIDSQMDHVTYRFTVNRTVTDVEVIVRYLGGGDLRITAFTVRDTGLASAKVLVALLPLMLLFDVCIWQYMVRKKRLCREQKQVILALGAIALIASLPIFVEYLRTGDDVYFHMNRIAGLAEAWRAGQFPVRIQYWWLYGAGYPISVMYGDFFLWIPAFLHLCGYDLPQSYLLWLLFWNLASAGIAYVSFRGIFRSRSAGLLGSALYTLSLYRLYNVHIRVAIGEYTAMTFLPLAVYGFVLLLQDHKERIRKSNASIILALAYSGMLLSHVLTLEIATISGALICLVNTRRLFRKESMLALLKAILLAVGLTAWFLIPFTDYFLHVDMGVFHVEREIQKFGLYLPQFLTCFPWMGGNTVFYEQGMTDIRPAAAGIGLLIGFLAVCKKRLVEKTYFRQHSRRTLISTAFGCALITSLMTLNSFPWDAFQSLSDTTYRLGASLQFPWRLLMLVTISMCIVIVADVTEMQRHGAQTRQAGAEWHSGAA